jgi:hypothetical protein
LKHQQRKMSPPPFILTSSFCHFFFFFRLFTPFCSWTSEFQGCECFSSLHSIGHTNRRNSSWRTREWVVGFSSARSLRR